MARSVPTASALEVALQALLRPLRFAAGDDASAANRVRDLEKSVVAACVRLREFAIPADLRTAVDAIADALFASPVTR